MLVPNPNICLPCYSSYDFRPCILIDSKSGEGERGYDEEKKASKAMNTKRGELMSRDTNASQ